MAEALLAHKLETWSVPGHAIRIEYSPAVLEEIRSEAVDGYHRAPHGGVEIGGVLFGMHEEYTVRITVRRPIACQFATGPSFVLTKREEAALADALKEWRNDPEITELEPVGWYRSHNRSEVLLSDTDLSFFNRFFAQDWQVGLIVRPASLAPTRAGFFFREADGSIRTEGTYAEFVMASFPFDRQPDTKVAVAEAPLVREARRNVTLERLPVVEEAQLRPLPPEARASAQVESRRAAEHGASGVRGGWKWYMAAAAVLATAAAGYWPRGSAHGLALSATDATGQMHIMWDRSAQAIQHSTGGSVQILDRGVRTEVTLTSKDLRSGSISYARQSGDVELRLVVYQPGRPAVEEMMVFLKPSETTAPVPTVEATDTKQAERSLVVDNLPVKQPPVAQARVTPRHASKSRSDSRAAKSRSKESRSKVRLVGSQAARLRAAKAQTAKSRSARSPTDAGR